MTLAPSPVKRYTAEEYLALEVKSDIRNEFRNGDIIPMTGAPPEHNEIAGNLCFLLKAALRRKAYSVFVTDQRLWIPEPDLYTYPDIMVMPRPFDRKPGRKDTVMNPILIAETLSDSTAAYDRDEKFKAYRTISSFQEYLLIEQYQPHVEQYVKQSKNQWLFTEYQGLDTHFSLVSVPGVNIALVDLYEAIEFDSASETQSE